MKMLDTVRGFGAVSVGSVVRLHKKNEKNKKYDYWPEYVGFTIPMAFVIGYGMDYNEYLRDMQHISIISKSAITKFEV